MRQINRIVHYRLEVKDFAEGTDSISDQPVSFGDGRVAAQTSANSPSAASG